MWFIVWLIAGLSLQSAVAIAQPSAPTWIADWRTGCRVWEPSPVPTETVTWSGECRNGLAHGRGVLQFSVDSRPFQRFEGELRDGKADGTGILWDDHGRYEGEWRDSRRNGHGVLTRGNAYRYDGEWRDDRMNGGGIETLPDGTRYEGAFANNAPNGTGKVIFANGETYSGLWTNGCLKDGANRAAVGVDLSTCP